MLLVVALKHLTSAEQFFQKFSKASFAVFFQHQQGNILHQPGLLHRIEPVVPATHHTLPVEQEKVFGMGKGRIGSHISHTGFKFVQGKIVDLLLVAGSKPPAFMIGGIAVGELAQGRYRIVFGIDADGDELHDTVLAVGIGILQLLHVARHTGTDGRAFGEKEIDDQDLVFHRIERNRLTQLVDEPDIAYPVPLGIWYCFTPFGYRGHAIVKIAQGHVHGFGAIVFHSIITRKREEEGDAETDYRSFIHIL